MNRLRQATLALVAAMLGGCGLFGSLSQPDGGASGSGGSYGFGRPTVEITINGVHFGPSAPDPGAGVSVSSSRDSTTGVETESTLTINALSTAAGASCGLSFQRYGTNLAPFRSGGTYTVSATTSNGTGDEQITPTGGESIGSSQGSFQCSGSTCDGGVLLLTVLAADHTEGSFSGTFYDASSNPASIVCSFWLPTLSYSP